MARRAQARRALHEGEEEPQRFRSLSRALLTLSPGAPQSAIYAIFGEVLGEYLELLSALHPQGPELWASRLDALRAALRAAEGSTEAEA